jgi:hypothetical protein
MLFTPGENLVRAVVPAELKKASHQATEVQADIAVPPP